MYGVEEEWFGGFGDKTYSDLNLSALLNRHILNSDILFAIICCGTHVGVEVPDPKSCSISPVMTEFTNAASSAHISS
jgi:hypothetical protein